MAIHNLFRSGLGTSNPGYAMYPSVEQHPDKPMESAAHKTPVHFGLSWGLAPNRGKPYTDLRTGFLAQAAYFECLTAPLAVGDVINAVVMPKASSLIDLWYFNCKAIPGLTMELRVRGNADSLGGTLAAPVPVVLGTIDFGVANTRGDLIGFSAVSAGGGDADGQDVAGANHHNGVYFDQNDMLQLVITAVPADLDPSCIRFGMTPVVREYCHGDIIECLMKGM